MDQILKSPEHLAVVLKTLSPKNKITLFRMEDNTLIPFLFSFLKYPVVLPFIFRNMNAEECLATLNLLNEEQHHLFFMALKQPLLFKALLIRFPSDCLNHVLSSQNHKGETYLEHLLTQPELYHLFISHLPKNNLFDFLSKECAQSSQYMKILLGNRHLFETTCENLSSSVMYQIIEFHNNIIIPLAVNNRGLLRLLLKTLEPEHIKQLINTYPELNKIIEKHFKLLTQSLDIKRITILKPQETLSQQFSIFSHSTLGGTESSIPALKPQ